MPYDEIKKWTGLTSNGTIKRILDKYDSTDDVENLNIFKGRNALITDRSDIKVNL